MPVTKAEASLKDPRKVITKACAKYPDLAVWIDKVNEELGLAPMVERGRAKKRVAAKKATRTKER